MRNIRLCAALALALGSWACDDGAVADGAEPDALLIPDASHDATEDATPDTRPERPDGAGEDDAGPRDAGPPPEPDEGVPELFALRLPQVVAGAVGVNPNIQPEVQLRVETDGVADTVFARLDGQRIEGVRTERGWRIPLRVDSLADGVWPLMVNARAGREIAADVELVVARGGVQLTDWNVVGRAGTPRLHRHGEDLWLTWVDRRAGASQLFRQQLDGAGRPLGEPERLLAAPENGEWLSARVAWGTDRLAILTSAPGEPYRNALHVLALDGTPLRPPLDLDPLRGADGGDIQFDGAAFDVTWRTVLASGLAVQWLRLDATTAEIIGPTTVAETIEPDARFRGISPVSVAPGLGVSAIGFIRSQFDDVLEVEVERAQVALVDHADGGLLSTQLLSRRPGFWFEVDVRMLRLMDGWFPVWTVIDLTADAMPQLVATQWDPAARLPRAAETVLTMGPQDRLEPTVAEHPDHLGVLVWAEFRSLVEAPPGRIELYTAAIDGELGLAEPRPIGHALLYASLSRPNAIDVGGNTLVTWIDYRNSAALDPRPEIWLDLIWY